LPKTLTVPTKKPNFFPKDFETLGPHSFGQLV
jgi:hypothetical protein